MSTDLPKTFNPSGSMELAGRPQVFDPALKHYSSAFRPGDPSFQTPDAAARWHAARREATDHVLRALAESPWGKQLVLRGSRLMKAWFGDAAREPGDLDYVVQPETAKPADTWSTQLLAGLVAAVAARPAPGRVAFLMADVATDDIWTYERAEGRRIVFPWRVAGSMGGGVQVDVVFGETLAETPTPTAIPTADGGVTTVLSATAGESLAWKFVWLQTDMYAQGKDLYDAVLLAESAYLPREILDRKLYGATGYGISGASILAQRDAVGIGTAGAFTHAPNVENESWVQFLKEYPWVVGDADTWGDRLLRALAPTFATCEQPAFSKVDVPAWRTSDVLGLARAIEDRDVYDRLPVLADALEEAGCDDADVLDHCRAGHPHGRDCWVTAWLLRSGDGSHTGLA